MTEQHAYFMRSVKGYSLLPQEKLVILSELDEKTISRIENGVVFIHAPWSGSSINGFRTLTAIMRSSGFERPLFVADIGIVDLPLKYFHGIRFGGHGETLFIRRGVVIARLSDYTERDAALVGQFLETML